MRTAASILVYLGLSVWIGGLVMFGAVVAPVLFGGVIPRTLAGALNASILSRLGVVEIVAGVMLVGGLLYGAIRVGSWMNWSALVLSVAMLATATYYSTVLFPRVNRLRVEIGSFESIGDEKMSTKSEFDSGHTLYSTLAKGVLFAAIGVLILHTVSLVRSGEQRERITRSSGSHTGPLQADAEKPVEQSKPSAARM